MIDPGLDNELKNHGVVANAKALSSQTSSVDISASPAPAAGYVLVATSPTTAVWQNPVLVWTSGPDLVLGIDQSAKITATAATSIPLHVACADGQVYEIDMVGTYTLAAAGTNAYLQINNTVPSTNSFTIHYVNQVNSTTNGASYPTFAANGHLLSIGGGSVEMCKATVWTSTANKKAIVESDCPISGTTISMNLRSTHNDTTTPYTSLGTVILPNATTCVINVRRVA